jgi:exonuclease III
MPLIYKIATLNINGITSHTKIKMLEELLRKHDIDIAVLQEVTDQRINTIRRNNTHMNERTEGRGTAIAVKEGIHATDIKRLPTGRGIAAKINGIWIVNTYAPSGAKKKQERVYFYSTDLTYILPLTYTDMIIAGDLNCTLKKEDSTGTKNYSRELENILTGLSLMDAWDTTKTRDGYTHYTANGASRIDRIYATRDVITRKTGIEIIAVAFTDHSAVIMRIAIETPLRTRGRGYWKMNINLIKEKTFRKTITEQLEKWKMHTRHYPNCVMWWDRYSKRIIKQLFIAEGTERRRDRQKME